MLEYERVKKMCYSFEDYAYHRPFICKGNVNSAVLFLVGINPATPIYPSQMALDDFVHLIMDYERFIKYYTGYRRENGKTEFSKTRIGINSLVNWISKENDLTVLETDIISYPTSSIQELRAIPKEIKHKGILNFLSLLEELEPKLVILHGKKTIKYFNRARKIPCSLNLPSINTDIKIDEIEKLSSLGEIIYKSGSKGKVIGCRHLKHYGKDGKTFSKTKDNILRNVD